MATHFRDPKSQNKAREEAIGEPYMAKIRMAYPNLKPDPMWENLTEKGATMDTRPELNKAEVQEEKEVQKGKPDTEEQTEYKSKSQEINCLPLFS